jgi:hypothetical protein
VQCQASRHKRLVSTVRGAMPIAAATVTVLKAAKPKKKKLSYFTACPLEFTAYHLPPNCFAPTYEIKVGAAS